MEVINPILGIIAFGLVIIAMVFLLYYLSTRVAPHEWDAEKSGERSASNHRETPQDREAPPHAWFR